jgi:hypothetical protein
MVERFGRLLIRDDIDVSRYVMSIQRGYWNLRRVIGGWLSSANSDKLTSCKGKLYAQIHHAFVDRIRDFLASEWEVTEWKYRFYHASEGVVVAALEAWKNKGLELRDIEEVAATLALVYYVFEEMALIIDSLAWRHYCLWLARLADSVRLLLRRDEDAHLKETVQKGMESGYIDPEYLPKKLQFEGIVWNWSQ